MPRRRPLLDVLILALLALMLATGLPTWLPGVKTAERWLEPAGRVTGLQQSNWQLFAPEPDRMNAWIEAVVTFSDGSERTIASPDWQDRTLLQKFVQGRWPKIVDYVRRDDWKVLWDPYVSWIVRTVPKPGRDVHVTQVELIRHWWNVPGPEKIAAAHARFGQLPPPRDRFPHAYSYYVWRPKGAEAPAEEGER